MSINKILLAMALGLTLAACNSSGDNGAASAAADANAAASAAASAASTADTNAAAANSAASDAGMASCFGCQRRRRRHQRRFGRRAWLPAQRRCRFGRRQLGCQRRRHGRQRCERCLQGCQRRQGCCFEEVRFISAGLPAECIKGRASARPFSLVRESWLP